MSGFVDAKKRVRRNLDFQKRLEAHVFARSCLLSEEISALDELEYGKDLVPPIDSPVMSHTMLVEDSVFSDNVV